MNSGVFYPDVVAPYARGYWDVFHYDELGKFSLAAISQKNQILKNFKISNQKFFLKKIPKLFPKTFPKFFRKFDSGSRANIYLTN